MSDEDRLASRGRPAESRILWLDPDEVDLGIQDRLTATVPSVPSEVAMQILQVGHVQNVAVAWQDGRWTCVSGRIRASWAKDVKHGRDGITRIERLRGSTGRRALAQARASVRVMAHAVPLLGSVQEEATSRAVMYAPFADPAHVARGIRHLLDSGFTEQEAAEAFSLSAPAFRRLLDQVIDRDAQAPSGR